MSQRLTLNSNAYNPIGYVAFCGTRGIPANYGGFETAVEEISRRFVADGISTLVFCRSSNQEQCGGENGGRKLVFTSGSTIRALDTFVASFQTGRWLIKNRKNMRFAFWFNNANLPGILLTWLAGIPMAVNTDGLEWRRAKWSWPFKLYYWLSSWLIARLGVTLISDSHGIRDYYREHFAVESEFIPYGAPESKSVPPELTAQVLARYRVEPGRYLLQITRFEPDNLPYESAVAFAKTDLSSRGFRFVVIGFKDSTDYALNLKALDDNSGVAVYPAEYDAETLTVLRTHCFAYVHGNSVGGTNPALLEAMACCPRILAINSPFSKEVLGDLGVLFDPKHISDGLESIVQTKSERVELSRRVRARYSWDRVAAGYRNILLGKSAQYEQATTETVTRPNLAVAFQEALTEE